MKTINAKQLRSQLEETFDAVANGQDVFVTYRSKQPIRITSAGHTNADKKELSGLASFDASPKKMVKFDKNQSLKELYDQSLQQKYGK